MADHVRAGLPISDSEAHLSLNTANSRTLRTFKGAHFTVSVREEHRKLFIDARDKAGAKQTALFPLPDYTLDKAVELSALLLKAADFVLLVGVYGEELVQRYWGGRCRSSNRLRLKPSRSACGGKPCARPYAEPIARPPTPDAPGGADRRGREQPAALGVSGSYVCRHDVYAAKLDVTPARKRQAFTGANSRRHGKHSGTKEPSP